MTDSMNICEVCGAFKFVHEELCRDCAHQKRDREFGPLWDYDK